MDSANLTAQLPNESADADAWGLIGWEDYVMNAATWFKRKGVLPDEAAALLCQQNPSSEKCRPELVSTSETNPADYVALLKWFSQQQYAGEAHDLLFWLNEAKKSGRKYHSWIDEYIAAAIQVGHLNEVLGVGELPLKGPSDKTLPVKETAGVSKKETRIKKVSATVSWFFDSTSYLR